MRRGRSLRWMAALAVLATMAGAGAGGADADPAVRPPEQRQALLDLAYTLGRAHALHRVCAGSADDTWRGRMQKLLEVEAPPDALKTELTNSFNAGFATEEGRNKDCKTAAGLEADVARRGAELARRLAGAPP